MAFNGDEDGGFGKPQCIMASILGSNGRGGVKYWVKLTPGNSQKEETQKSVHSTQEMQSSRM